jgi:radical SAM-linked protein
MNEDQQRLRITFSKGDSVRYISHLDVARAWERALRRAGMPVAYSRGFHPHPKIVFAAALALGYTASAEILDVILAQPMPPRQVIRGLRPQLPAGLAVVDVTPVYLRAPALPTLLQGADYESVIESGLSLDEMQAQCRALLERESLPRTFRGKAYDLRPLVDGLEVVMAEGQCPVLRAVLAAGERGTGRLAEVLDELGWNDYARRHHRRGLRFG